MRTPIVASLIVALAACGGSPGSSEGSGASATPASSSGSSSSSSAAASGSAGATDDGSSSSAGSTTAPGSTSSATGAGSTSSGTGPGSTSSGSEPSGSSSVGATATSSSTGGSSTSSSSGAGTTVGSSSGTTTGGTTSTTSSGSTGTSSGSTGTSIGSTGTSSGSTGTSSGSTGTSSGSTGGSGCTINRQSYQSGELDPSNPCEACDPASSATDWTPVADATPCGSGLACLDGTCSSCFTGQGCSPANRCHRGTLSCVPNQYACNDTGSDVGDGASCGKGKVCVTGSCEAGCVIRYAFYSDGESDPANPCEVCDAAQNTIDWSTVTPGTSCGYADAGEQCQGTSCACPANQTLCTDPYLCADLMNDDDHCGQCTTVCGNASSCFGGLCEHMLMEYPRGALGGAVGNTGIFYFVGGSDGTRSAASTEGIDSHASYLTLADPALNEPRESLSAAALNGTIYAIGGLPRISETDTACAVKTVESFPEIESSWHVWEGGGTLVTARHGHASATGHDGHIYVFGGSDSCVGQPLNLVSSVEKLTIVNGTPIWSALASAAPLPHPRYGLAAATGPDGKIYVVGGIDVSTLTTGTLDIFDPATQTWQSGPAMPTARQGCAATFGPDGKLWVMGGESDALPYWNGFGTHTPLDTVELYDPATRQWSSGPGLPAATAWAAAGLGGDGRIYVAGNIYGPSQSALHVLDHGVWTQ